MAKNKSTVYLGYKGDDVTLKDASELNSLVNKIGGTADWPSAEIKVPACPLCATVRPLIAQLYVPLDCSQFHRTLYVFCCLNPTCSKSSKSWLCIRTQHLDTVKHVEESKNGKSKKPKRAKPVKSISDIWGDDADDWGDGKCISLCNDNGNGNSNDNDNANGLQLEKNATCLKEEAITANDVEDDGDESSSLDDELLGAALNKLAMEPAQEHDDDPNANCAAGITNPPEGQARAACAGDDFYAEIEGTETDVVAIDAPKRPQRDIRAMLQHTPSPAVLGAQASPTDVELKPFFIEVDLESIGHDKYISDAHVYEVYEAYLRQESLVSSPVGGNGATLESTEREAYDKWLPQNFDELFSKFYNTFLKNPQQILRYSRDAAPLLIAPLQEPLPTCPNCNGATICEVQILTSLIPHLRMHKTDASSTIDYGNVLIFTCLKSCWDTPDKMRYERVIVQADTYNTTKTKSSTAKKRAC